MDRNGAIAELKRVVDLKFEEGATLAEIKALGLSDFTLDADQKEWVKRFAKAIRNRLVRYYIDAKYSYVKSTIKTSLMATVLELVEDNLITVSKAKDLVASAIEELLEENNG